MFENWIQRSNGVINEWGRVQKDAPVEVTRGGVVVVVVVGSWDPGVFKWTDRRQLTGNTLVGPLLILFFSSQTSFQLVNNKC